MDRKKELKQQYKEVKATAGVFQIKNKKNGKVFVKSSNNLKTMNGETFQLEQKVHRNKALQHDWNEFGKESFVFEVLEALEEKEGEYIDKKSALKKTEEKWMEQLQPFGDKGYND